MSIDALPLVLDQDDDDEDGVPDCEQSLGVPLDDLLPLQVPDDASERVRVDAVGGVRLVLRVDSKRGDVLQTPASIRTSAIRDGQVWVQGSKASASPGDAELVVWSKGRQLVRRVSVFKLGFLDASNQKLDPSRAALGISRAVTDDATLPRSESHAALSAGPDNIRVEYVGPPGGTSDVSLGLRVLGRQKTMRERYRHLPGRQGPNAEVVRSQFLRLVAGIEDVKAPGAPGQIIRVGLRDHLRAVVLVDGFQYSQDIRIGKPGRDGGDRAALRGKMRVRVLRQVPGGPPSIGEDEASAIRLAREQVAIANEIWSQCFIDFGAPEDADVVLVDPPGPVLLSIADEDGLRARGDGQIHFLAGAVVIGPWPTRPGDTPLETALSLAGLARAAGLSPTVRANPRTDFGAHGSADLVIRDDKDNVLSVSRVGGDPISTDSRQRARIGVVDLRDGLQQFDNARAAAGSLEERTLAAIHGDADPTTIDLFIVNRFAEPGRQGEAFIEASGGPMINTVILDQTGVRNDREAWVQSHEIGHVLLDHPLHPDFTGPDRPWLLMDSDARRPGVAGPKRLNADECARVRSRSGPTSRPVLLEPGP